MRSRFLSLALIALTTIVCLPMAHAASAMRTVILVRHAEKVSTAPDSVLTPAGIERAATLAAVLAPAGIRHIIVTQSPRVQLTAAPLAAKLGLTPIVINSGDDHVAAVVAKILSLPAYETVLVIGHSNTLPAIMQKLGVEPPPVISDERFNDLFVLTLPEQGRPTLVHLTYGK